LIRTFKEIHAESAPVFYGANRFMLDTESLTPDPVYNRQFGEVIFVPLAWYEDDNSDEDVEDGEGFYDRNGYEVYRAKEVTKLATLKKWLGRTWAVCFPSA
jgi:hypothetical protein